MTSQTMNQNKRERILYQYSLALEAGDFDTLGEILALAENDLELGRMIEEVNEVYQAEHTQTADVDARHLVQQLLQEHLPSAFAEEVESVPLTVGDVAAKIQTDAALRGAAQKETLTVVRKLHNNPTPIPIPIRLPDIKQLFQQLGITVNARFEKLFQDTATLLLMGRGQSVMAATRRQKKESDHKPPEDTQ